MSSKLTDALANLQEMGEVKPDFKQLGAVKARRLMTNPITLMLERRALESRININNKKHELDMKKFSLATLEELKKVRIEKVRVQHKKVKEQLDHLKLLVQNGRGIEKSQGKNSDSYKKVYDAYETALKKLQKEDNYKIFISLRQNLVSTSQELDRTKKRIEALVKELTPFLENEDYRTQQELRFDFVRWLIALREGDEQISRFSALDGESVAFFGSIIAGSEKKLMGITDEKKELVHLKRENKRLKTKLKELEVLSNA